MTTPASKSSSAKGAPSTDFAAIAISKKLSAANSIGEVRDILNKCGRCWSADQRVLIGSYGKFDPPSRYLYLVLDETGKLVGLAIDADLRADGSVRRPFLFIGSHSFVFQSGGAQ